MNHAEKEKRAQFSGLLTEDSLQRMLEGKDYYVVHTVLLIAASSTDRSSETEVQGVLSRLSVDYSGIMKKVLVRCRDVRWPE